MSISTPHMQKRSSNKGTNSLPFKKILRAIMLERNLSAKQLAQLAGVKPTVIQNWIEGKNPHDLTAVDKLAQGLGLSFKGLLLGQSEPEKQTASISESYEEQEFFDGLAKIKITRLVPRKKES